MKVTCCWMYAIGKYGFPPSVENMVRAIGEMGGMGFDYIELEGVGFENLQGLIDHREQIKSAIENAAVRLSNFAVILPEILSADAGVQSRAFQALAAGADTAAYLGSPYLWINSYYPPVEFVQGTRMTEEISFGQEFAVRIPEGFSWPAFWERFTHAVSQANGIARARGLGLLVEPRVGEVTPNSDALLRLIEAVNDDNLGVILDTAHQHAQKELLPLSVEKLGKRIRYVHVADNDGRTNRHLPPGEGTIDWDELLRALKRQGFDGFFATDIEALPDLEGKFLATKRFLEEAGERIGL